MATLTTTRNYDDGEVLVRADLDAFLDDIEAFLNVAKINDDNIQNNGITGSTKLLNQSVSEAKIATGAVSNLKLASNAVTTDKITDESVTEDKLIAAVVAKLVPSGSITAFGSETAPTGWLVCDGTAVSRTTYADLFNVIGENFGQGDNSTTFNVPDFRGRFLRGMDDGQTRDPNSSTRTAMNTGGNTGDAVGSVQGFATGQPASTAFTADSNGAHTHTVAVIKGGSSFLFDGGGPNSGTSGSATTSSSGAHTHTISGGDAETRPINANVVYIIKT